MNMRDKENKPAPAVLEQLAGCRGLSMGLRTAGLDRDCYAIAAVQIRRSAICPGGISVFSNIIRMKLAVSSAGEQKGDRT